MYYFSTLRGLERCLKSMSCIAKYNNLIFCTLIIVKVPVKYGEFCILNASLYTQEKLGTMLDKVNRIQHTASKVGMLLGVNEDVLEVIQNAAALVMSDLATAVVTEFTSLAGIMGRHYALRDGFSKEVVRITLPVFFLS